MKKLLTVLIILLVLSGCSSKPQGRFSKLDVRSAQKMMDDKESFILYVRSSTCDKCAAYREILIKLFESEPMTVYYIDIDQQDEAEFRDLIYNYLGRCDTLPATYIIKEGKVADHKEEIIELGDLKLWFLENGIIS